jgi:hypothetical protein
MSQTPPAGTPAPNPAVIAFFRSTTWKLLIFADVVAMGAGVAGYLVTNNVLAFAPMALVAVAMGLSIIRVARGGAAPPDGDDQLVR